jgi:hypothetical protein
MTLPAVAVPGSLPDGWIKRVVGILLAFHIVVSYLLVNQVLASKCLKDHWPRTKLAG